MPSTDRISALRGMRAVFGGEYAGTRAVQRQLERHLWLHGYAPIELPILENTELYLRKAGESAAARLYDFHFKSRRIALRPELTASCLRAYVEHWQDEPLPLRLQYGGPVFRYEKPQQNRYRQFTLAGAELLGARGALADAEIVHLACGGLEKLGIRRCRLVIGHGGVLESFLQRLGLRQQLLNFLLRNMENIRKRGMPAVVEALREIYPQFDADGADLTDAQRGMPGGAAQSQQLIRVLREMQASEAHQAIADFLHSLNIRIDSDRDKNEVIDRLLHKIREDPQSPKLHRALEYMQQLSGLVGAPEAVLPQARALLAKYDAEAAADALDAVDSLEAMLHSLRLMGGVHAEIELDLGLNRGLHYYTGLMFELQGFTAAGEAVKLCGGGRYDDLVGVLGGSAPTPALGFAYGIERIASLLGGGGGPSLRAADVLVVPVAAAEAAFAFEVARMLRGGGCAVEVGIDGRSLKKTLKAADRRRLPLVIVVGEAESRARRVILRDMAGHQERAVALGDLLAEVERLLADEG